MFRSGSFVADHVEPIADSQVQPNGVDLTLDSLYEQVSPGRLGVDGKEIGDRESVSADSDDGSYVLPPGGYILQYAETIHIPEGHVGFLYPRSSLMRNSCMLNTAVWDAGYEGKGEGLLQVHHDIELEPGARIAQLVLARGNHDGVYDGSYQGERVNSPER
ncbi:deoxyuridine 5'-triphosphate nucleotidohydrolase [Halogeometricum borinquense]|uniref:Deoxyuridine 5'-triphosphate nucleotidohydrolase n=1 Tax=Halogeometricum borinquense TaxID=60847 RepID=A0A6C0UMR9_9EURY|nr:deoxyuridine 5'-triphosphate nucleotidohydrolase [Halogeometricum borinquense]QIB75873.1 deoxyuridine 5'-triphosphate nucleotidohydrolase [Halogeometricum borinquense]QIQ75544.1 deoxyuridine 5'-triphosphate nucleotidohydrolase [Halogeometricum borinquense]